jgi:hypothetical protein
MCDWSSDVCSSDLLELEFHEEEAERQLDTAIDWGRYSELLAYDDTSQVLFLEPGGAMGFGKAPAGPSNPQ